MDERKPAWGGASPFSPSVSEGLGELLMMRWGEGTLSWETAACHKNGVIERNCRVPEVSRLAPTPSPGPSLGATGTDT